MNGVRWMKPRSVRFFTGIHAGHRVSTKRHVANAIHLYAIAHHSSCCGLCIRVNHVCLNKTHQARCRGIMLTDAQACELLVKRYGEFLAKFNTPLVE